MQIVLSSVRNLGMYCLDALLLSSALRNTELLLQLTVAAACNFLAIRYGGGVFATKVYAARGGAFRLLWRALNCYVEVPSTTGIFVEAR